MRIWSEKVQTGKLGGGLTRVTCDHQQRDLSSSALAIQSVYTGFFKRFYLIIFIFLVQKGPQKLGKVDSDHQYTVKVQIKQARLLKASLRKWSFYPCWLMHLHHVRAFCRWVTSSRRVSFTLNQAFPPPSHSFNTQIYSNNEWRWKSRTLMFAVEKTLVLMGKVSWMRAVCISTTTSSIFPFSNW